MIARASFVAFALVVGLTRSAHATPLVPPAACVTATLDAYIALLGVGCSIDDEVAYFDFGFVAISSAGGAAIAPADITVTPSGGGPLQGLDFTSPKFSVTGAQELSFLITYDIDPHPILFGFDLEMEAFSPSAPGVATITTDLCIGAVFGGTPAVPTPCSGTAATVTVFHAGTTSDLTDGIDFGGTFAELGVRNTISLDANGANADFTGFGNTNTVVPEPATLWLVAIGVAGRRLARRRSSLR